MTEVLERTADIAPPPCEKCGMATARLGKLPKIGLRPLIYVYRCEPCSSIVTVEPMNGHGFRQPVFSA